MKTLAPNIPFKSLPNDYSALCLNVWPPRPIRDKTDYQAALDAIAPMWGYDKSMSRDKSDWFALVADLVAEWEDAHDRKKAAPLPLAQCSAGLLVAHGMTAADLGRLLELEASMGSKIINGKRQLTAAHIRKLSAHLALHADYFL
jgi:antitoxin component HigA of HigAB toxin-antitoxin module